jgi:hypothetical protein
VSHESCSGGHKEGLVKGLSIPGKLQVVARTCELYNLLLVQPVGCVICTSIGGNHLILVGKNNCLDRCRRNCNVREQERPFSGRVSACIQCKCGPCLGTRRFKCILPSRSLIRWHRDWLRFKLKSFNARHNGYTKLHTRLPGSVNGFQTVARVKVNYYLTRFLKR